MSTSSMKRLSIRARNSIPTLNMFCDKSSNLNETPLPQTPSKRENAIPGIDEFGLSSSNQRSRCTATHHPCPSPAKESPSRRKKLIGSLRSMTSLRSVHTSSRKHKDKENAESYPEPVGPRTPIRNIRPSLTLNFEQSAPDEPMFDVMQRGECNSSSITVHHSSPIPIPTLAEPANILYKESVIPICLPVGTVPTSPAPIQMLLENDRLSDPELDPLPTRVEKLAHAMPTPLPGTDVTLGAPTSLAVEIEEYFHLRRESLKDVDVRPTEVACEAARQLGTEEHEDSPPATVIEPDEMPLTGPRKQSATGHCDELKSPESELGLEEFDHVLYAASHISFSDLTSDEGASPTQPSETSARSLSGSQCSGSVQTKADGTPRTKPDEVDEHYGPRHPGRDWGTHGSLYNGTGYGAEGDFSSMRRTSPSTMAKGSFESSGASGCARPACHVIVEEGLGCMEHLDAMSRDHETLEEVIRAYAMYEDECGCGSMDDYLQDVKEDGGRLGAAGGSAGGGSGA